jgi:hypothetical protein
MRDKLILLRLNELLGVFNSEFLPIIALQFIDGLQKNTNKQTQ